MKRYLSILLLISSVLSIFTFESCKKGPNDPFISFKSRKARMTGDWIIKDRTEEHTTDMIGGDKYIYSLISSGESITEAQQTVNTDLDTAFAWSGVVHERTFNFDKDGDVDYNFHYTLTQYYYETDEEATITVDSVVTIERKYFYTGTWNFLSNVDDYKNKERLSIMWETFDFEQIDNTKIIEIDTEQEEPVAQVENFRIRTHVSNFFANGEESDIWILDKLKSKEVTMYRWIDNNTRVNVEGNETTNTSVKGQELLELEQE